MCLEKCPDGCLACSGPGNPEPCKTCLLSHTSHTEVNQLNSACPWGAYTRMKRLTGSGDPTPQAHELLDTQWPRIARLVR